MGVFLFGILFGGGLWLIGVIGQAYKDHVTMPRYAKERHAYWERVAAEERIKWEARLRELAEPNHDEPRPMTVPTPTRTYVREAPAPQPSATATSPALTKRCPDCAEEVKADARICRFCRYEF